MASEQTEIEQWEDAYTVEPVTRCEYPFTERGPFCQQVSEWEGWIRRSPMVVKVRVCDEHKRELIGEKEKRVPLSEATGD